MKVNSIELRVCESRFGTRGGRKDGANLASSTAKAAHVFGVSRRAAAGEKADASPTEVRDASRTFVRTPSSNDEAVSLIEKFERHYVECLEDFNQYKHAYTDTKKTLLNLYEIKGNKISGAPSSVQNAILNKLAAYSFKYYKVQMVLIGEDGTRVYSKIQPRMHWSDPSGDNWSRKVRAKKESAPISDNSETLNKSL